MQNKIKKIIFAAKIVFLTTPAISLASGWNVDGLTGFNLPTGTIFGIIQNILFWLLGVLGIIGVIGFVISGILYLVSAGDDDTMKRAKNAMKYSIIGIIVGLSGLVVILAVDTLLSGVSTEW